MFSVVLDNAEKNLLKLDPKCDVMHLLYLRNEKELWLHYKTTKQKGLKLSYSGHLHALCSLPLSQERDHYLQRVSINRRWFYWVCFFSQVKIIYDTICFLWRWKLLPCPCDWEQCAVLMAPLVSECAERTGEEESWFEEHHGKLHRAAGSGGREWDFPGGETVCP